MHQYRTRPKIISEVLSSAGSNGQGLNITGVMRRCNLSYSLTASLLGELVGAGLMLESKDEHGKKYMLSGMGSIYLEKYAQLREFVETYGLRL
ncbi:MAG: hypothetical protein OK456_08130 [Thaumarchaeota archaeon]|nr:hypothetical protein [Nitrososphaerota archaeon]